MHLITLDSAAEILAVKRVTIDRMIKRGQLPAVEVSVSRSAKHKRLRIQHSDLVLFVESRKVATPRAVAKTRRQYRAAIRAEVMGNE
jgi:excisionase family DNA binding protein